MAKDQAENESLKEAIERVTDQRTTVLTQYLHGEALMKKQELEIKNFEAIVEELNSQMTSKPVDRRDHQQQTDMSPYDLEIERH
jgi:hypothetical protein